MSDPQIRATPDSSRSRQVTPIAELTPEASNQQYHVVEGEVTITWPYSIITKSIAFKLVESDFRLRMNNGQVRVDFHGAAGKAVARAAIGGGDEVQLSLEGVEWVEAPLPKRADTLEWQMMFTDRLRMKVKRADDGGEMILDVNGPDLEGEEEPLQPTVDTIETPNSITHAPARLSASASVEPTPSPMFATPAPPNKRLASAAFEEDEYASPAFLKRTRISHGGFWEGDLEDFDDQPKQKKQKRKSRFSMVEKWKYSSRTPSPEPEVQQELEEPESEDEEPAEERIPVVKPSPPMVDEGVQTRIEDNVPMTTSQAPQGGSAESPGPPSSPTPAGIPKQPASIPEPPAVQIEEEDAPALNIAEERRQPSPQPNPFAAFQPSFGQSNVRSTPGTSGFGSGAASGFGTGSGFGSGNASEFASQAPFGAAPAATFGMSSTIGAASSSFSPFGPTSGPGFGTNTGSAFGANTGNAFGRGFGMSNGNVPEPSTSAYPEPPINAQQEPMEEDLSEDEVNRLYKANEFYSAPADYGVAPESDLHDHVQGDAGDFTHDIANNAPAFAPSQLEQASWGTLTSLPPQSPAHEPNDFDNPMEILSSSPPRAPSPDEEPETIEFEDQQPEISDVEQEEGEHLGQQGYMPVDPVPEDAPIDSDDTPAETQAEDTDDYRDGGDVAGEDYDLRNYDIAQDDDVVESDDGSVQLTDKNDPDEQIVDNYDNESDVDEEEELEFEPPAHGLSNVPGEFDAEDELGEEEDYEEYSDEEDSLDYDEEELGEDASSPRAPEPPASKEPVFIDLLSDSDDDEAPTPAPARPAAPPSTAAAQEPQGDGSDDDGDQDEGLAKAEDEGEGGDDELLLEAELNRHPEDRESADEVDEEDGHLEGAPSRRAAEKAQGDCSDVDTPPSQRSSPPPSEDEGLGPANAPYSVSPAVVAEEEQDASDEILLVEDDELVMEDAPQAEDDAAVEVADVVMQDHVEAEPPQPAADTQGTTSDKNTQQTSVSFESQPRNNFDFEASMSQPANSLSASREEATTTGPTVEEASVDEAAAAESVSPKIIETEVEVTDAIEEVHVKPATVEEVNEPQGEADVVNETSVEADIVPVPDELLATPDEVMAETPMDIADGQQRHRDSSIIPEAEQQTIDEASTTSPPETQTLRAQAPEELQPPGQDDAVTGEELQPTPSERQASDSEMQLGGEDSNDADSEAEYTLALQEQIITESQSFPGSEASQAEIPSIEAPETSEEPNRRVTRSRAKDKPERDILITVQSLRSWDRKSLSVATEEDPSLALAMTGSQETQTQEKVDNKERSRASHATPEPRQRSESQASPQSIRITRSRAHDDDPSLLLAGETPKPKGRKRTPTRTRETRSSVAASAEPEEQAISQTVTATHSLRATRSKAREQDPGLMFADVKESRETGSSHVGSQGSLATGKPSQTPVHATRSQDKDDDPSLFLTETTPKPRKIRGEVTPEPELGSERSLRSRTPEPHKIRGEVTPDPELGSERSLRSRTPDGSAAVPKSPTATRDVAAEDSSFMEEDETIATLKSKLSKELRTNLADCLSLSTLRSHLNQHTDIIGVVTATPEPPYRPKSGPRDYMLEILITDPASASSSSAITVTHLFRPHRQSLPSVTAGDVILLRHFHITAMKGRGYGLRSGDNGSSWAVWEKLDEEGLPQIKGPPVELGEAEGRYTEGLRKWWGLVEEDGKVSEKIERKVQQAVRVGRENRGKVEKGEKESEK